MDTQASTRAPKTPQQVAAIEEVQRATESAVAKVVAYLRSSAAPTSEEAHAIIEAELTRLGCESPEGHIIAGGTQSASPHAMGAGALKRGEPIVMDIYPRSKKTGYFADMSRTLCLGTPSAELQKMYDTVLGAQEMAIKMLRPGAACKEIQTAVENYFIERGYVTSGVGDPKDGFPYAEGFVHGVGHGVGLAVHEAPRIGRKSTDILAEGDVVTVEPGLYYKHIGGVRIEDMFLVTKDGSRSLTHFGKEFVL